MEELRQTAILAEKVQPLQISTLETYDNLLQEIKTLKEEVLTQNSHMNAIQHVNQQHSYRAQTVLTPLRFRITPSLRNKQVRPQQYYPRNDQSVSGMRPPIVYQQTPLFPHGRQPCSYCLGLCQIIANCPSKNAICHSCSKVGHYSRACRLAAKPIQ